MTIQSIHRKVFFYLVFSLPVSLFWSSPVLGYGKAYFHPGCDASKPLVCQEISIPNSVSVQFASLDVPRDPSGSELPEEAIQL